MGTIPQSVKRPVLRYHGGKWILAPWIIQNLPRHKVYVEPYGGAASVLLRKSRSYAEIYNDMDGEIVNLFRVLRNPDQAKELIRLLKLTPFAREEFELSYLESRDPIEQARRTIARSFMGFGSGAATGNSTGFRNNAHRSGSTPAADWSNYPDSLAFVVKRLIGVVIENRPAIDLILHVDKTEDTLFYVDPPYPLSTRGKQHDSGYRYEMTDSEHSELAKVLKSTIGMVVISGYSCTLYNELYSDWRKIEKDSFADGTRKRTETLWIKPGSEVQLSMGL